MASIRLVSLNIERALHLDTVLPFLKERKPDVCCLQELREPDIPRFLDALSMRHFAFVPMSIHPSEGHPAPTGLGILSRFPMDTHVHYYRGIAGSPPKTFDFPDSKSKFESEHAMVLFGTIHTGNTSYTIGTTHFGWTPNGKPDEYQRKDLAALLPILDAAGEFVLTGDFNAPRGGEIFSEFARRYTDNIPLEYKTSIDLTLHRAARTKRNEIADKMVDGLFTTPAYTASNVSLEDGVSDHCAVVATIKKR
ncbi:MAG: endonuclease/exonuclease/phosphatase [Parcubacteria group bacterium Gr01-1014_8]|nr:MAG: endonuclease/exonuclease/phosphatase [Parcubacteria group bacterium Gr01-1014_8]